LEHGGRFPKKLIMTPSPRHILSKGNFDAKTPFAGRPIFWPAGDFFCVQPTWQIFC
jgi:hypothetical protein